MSEAVTPDAASPAAVADAPPPVRAAPQSGPPPGIADRTEFEKQKDSLHILPLSLIPFETPGLKRARMLKDARLNSVVELFHTEDAGSGVLDRDQFHEVFGWPRHEEHRDVDMIRGLASLTSYDVFSLRVELRRLGIPVNDFDELRLSDAKSRELAVYMTDFTRPLMQQVFGGADAKFTDFNELIETFARPNKADALKNLQMIAEKLRIGIDEVPAFLEDYGDIFLSLAYFKEELDATIPLMLDLTTSLKELREHYQLAQDRHFVDLCGTLGNTFSDIMNSITGRFESFERHSQGLWENNTVESFTRVRKLITAHHTTIGGVLCGLRVKMIAWNERFGGGRGGPIQRADFINSDIKQGIDRIRDIEAQAPKLSEF